MKRNGGRKQRGEGGSERGIVAGASDALRRSWASLRGTIESMTASDTDALVMLEAQHRQVDGLMAQIASAAGRPGRRTGSLIAELAEALELHAAIEEQHFYPAVRTAQTEDLVSESFDEHRRMKRALAELVAAGNGARGDVAQKLARLEELVVHHAKVEEEGKLFPRVREMLDGDQREALGQEMLATMVDLQQPSARRAPVRGAPATA